MRPHVPSVNPTHHVQVVVRFSGQVDLKTWGTDGGGQRSEAVASVAVSTFAPTVCLHLRAGSPGAASSLLHKDPRWLLCAAAAVSGATSWVGS